jgi:hypothetical protein
VIRFRVDSRRRANSGVIPFQDTGCMTFCNWPKKLEFNQTQRVKHAWSQVEVGQRSLQIGADVN